MKKILMVAIMAVLTLSIQAQDLSEGQKAKNAGNDAYRNKNYVEAIENWEKYFNSGEEGVTEDTNTQSLYQRSFLYAASDFMKAKNYSKAYDYFKKYREIGGKEAKTDGKITYYMAYCASKMDKNDLALSHFQESIDLEYREDISMLYMAQIYKDAGDDAKMVSTLKTALEKYPKSKEKSKMLSMLTVPMLKEAAEPFNQANELAKAAASGDPNDYLTNMSKAVTKFQEAKPLFEEILKIDPTNSQAKTYIGACDDNINAFNEYKDSLNK
ncbi:MAG: tetratricopeptide repeat protein [Prolixibacteraceae bacterium]|nr:tetratricopeptide repeat protein [Prolixibacteraceae bacterium]MBN2649411.1 tetratricopeptide repeat protein [Prolixibacteraceae bacterium]